MKKIEYLTPANKVLTWTQTDERLYVGDMACEGCTADLKDVSMADATKHAATCRVIRVTRI